MAFGHTRLDVRRPQQSSSYCSTTTVVVAFVALCLVGVWMASSVLVTPAEFSPFQPKVRPLVRDDPPPIAGDGGDATTEMEPDVSADPTPVEQSTDVPPVREENTDEPPVKEDNVTESSVDGANQQHDFRKQGRQADGQNGPELKEKLDEEEQSQNKDKPVEVFPDGSRAELLNETTTELLTLLL